MTVCQIGKRVVSSGRVVCGENSHVRRVGKSPAEVKNLIREAVAKVIGYESFDAIPLATLVWFREYINTPDLFEERPEHL